MTRTLGSSYSQKGLAGRCQGQSKILLAVFEFSGKNEEEEPGKEKSEDEEKEEGYRGLGGAVRGWMVRRRGGVGDRDGVGGRGGGVGAVVGEREESYKGALHGQGK